MPEASLAISFSDIETAAARIKGQAVRTPLLSFPVLNDHVGGQIFIKPENLQRTGSFKFRGGFNRLSALSKEERARGVVAFSSGNHAQGVAAAAEILGVKAVIVMPEDAPSVKVEGTKSYGAEVVSYDRYKEDRETVAADICARTGAILVPSYNDPFIMAGQGTAGLEIAEDLKAIDVVPDQSVFCCGGGGLASGSFMALRQFFPALSVYTAEPANYDDAARTFQTGQLEFADTSNRSICDALLTPSLGELTYPVLKELAAQGLAVTDEEALAAVRFAAEKLKLVLEPGGAVALACVLFGKLPVKGRKTAIVLSGGNVDPTILTQALAA